MARSSHRTFVLFVLLWLLPAGVFAGADDGTVGSTFFENSGQLDSGALYEVRIPGDVVVGVSEDGFMVRPEATGRAAGETPLATQFKSALAGATLAPTAGVSKDVVYVFSGDAENPLIVGRTETLAVSNLYDGIDAVYTTDYGHYHRTLTLSPGADSQAIQLRYKSGAEPVLNADGTLSIGPLSDYVRAETEGRPVPVRFVERMPNHYGIELESEPGATVTVTFSLDYTPWLSNAKADTFKRLGDHPGILGRLPEASAGDLLVFSTGTPFRPAGGAVSGAAPSVKGGATTYAGGNYNCSSIILQSGDSLDPSSGAFTEVLSLVVPAGVTVPVLTGGTLDVTAAYVRVDGVLDANGVGAAGGPGAPASGGPFSVTPGNAGSGTGGGGGATGGGFFDEVAGGGGAGYGGTGGNGSAGDDGGTPGAGGGSYGMALPPGIAAGSGGGSGATSDSGASGAGGNGGGAVRLLANDYLLNGTLRANGNGGGGAGDDAGGSGGGSGGGLELEATRNTQGGGALQARGGNGSGGANFAGSGGGGAGGRIKFSGPLDPGASLTTDAGGGSGAGSFFAGPSQAGGAGSVDFSNAVAPNPGGADVTSCNVSFADLSVSKTDSPDPIVAGSGASIVYTVTVDNFGPLNATNVVVTDTLPAGVTLASTSGCAEDPNGVPTCTLGNISAGSSASYTINTQPLASSVPAGTLDNTAVVAGSEADISPPDNTAVASTTVQSEVDLAITKTDGITAAVPGESLVYTIIASNPGPSDDPSVSVTDTFPAELSCAWTSVAAGGATGNSSSSGNLNDTLSMPAGSSVTYTVTCGIDPAATGTLSNTAAVLASVTETDPGDDSATDDDTALTPEIDLVTSKTIISAPADPELGNTVQYQLAVTNNGPSTATNVVVTDTLPPEVAFAGSDCGLVEGPPNVLTWTVGTLAPQQQVVCTLNAEVINFSDLIVNAATASADQFDTDGSNNSDTAESVGAKPVVPALGPLGLLALLTGVVGLAAWRLRRRR